MHWRIVLTLALLITVATAQPYTVKPGDTLYAIAKANGTSLTELLRLNKNVTERLQPGQVLQLPNSSRPTSNPTVASVGSVQRTLFDPSSVTNERPLWPTEGVITTNFTYRGRRTGHSGIDIAAPMGTPIYAALSGRVSSSGWNPFGYGRLVIIRGVDGRDYYYAHTSKLLVRAGQVVEQGERIALMGSTGHSTGPHLHFEVRDGVRILNPFAVLPTSRVQLASYRGR
jgi:murein DD-endopeptidase MepM/ murein hydrolase activator NlpD